MLQHGVAVTSIQTSRHISDGRAVHFRARDTHASLVDAHMLQHGVAVTSIHTSVHACIHTSMGWVDVHTEREGEGVGEG